MPEASKLLKVVLIEDNTTDAELFKQMLERLNYKPDLQHFLHGEEALEYLQTSTNLPHLIVLDLNLSPGAAHGLEILKKIKELPAISDIPVIIHSASQKSEDVLQSFRSGSCFFARKIYDVAVLGETIGHLRVTGRLKDF
jgi:CheY-like chemotaxis protein